MASIDFDPKDYLDEIKTTDLLNELKKRRKVSAKDIENIDMPDFKTSLDLKNYTLRLFGLKKWHGKERLIEEINTIF